MTQCDDTDTDSECDCDDCNNTSTSTEGCEKCLQCLIYHTNDHKSKPSICPPCPAPAPAVCSECEKRKNEKDDSTTTNTKINTNRTSRELTVDDKNFLKLYGYLYMDLKNKSRNLNNSEIFRNEYDKINFNEHFKDTLGDPTEFIKKYNELFVDRKPVTYDDNKFKFDDKEIKINNDEDSNINIIKNIFVTIANTGDNFVNYLGILQKDNKKLNGFGRRTKSNKKSNNKSNKLSKKRSKKQLKKRSKKKTKKVFSLFG